MVGALLALLVVVASGYLIVNKYKPQAVLFMGGFIMMALAIIIGYGPILEAKQSTGSQWFDIFQFVDIQMATRTAKLGLLIMACAGFARYMNLIGASEAMVQVASKPLHYIKSPYIVLGVGFLVGQVLHLFVPSASGLGMLLMMTLYPIYTSLGISPITATAVIATNGCLDLGPSSGSTVMAAKYAGLSAIDYFMNYQIYMALAITFVMLIVHYFVAIYYERKHKQEAERLGITVEEMQQQYLGTTGKETKKADAVPAPSWYALLPTIPVVLVLLYGYFKFGGIKMDITVAIFLGIFISMMIEFLRKRDAKMVMNSIQSFFDGMGVQFATVVTLIVAGETFAQGLTSLGAVDYVIKGAEYAGFGVFGMTLIMCAVIGIATIIMGSGNAPFFAFSAFAPNIAKDLGVESVRLLLPMQLTSSVMRGASPITAVVVAVSGVSGVSPFDVIKQTWPPLIAGAITIQVMAWFMW